MNTSFFKYKNEDIIEEIIKVNNNNNEWIFIKW